MSPSHKACPNQTDGRTATAGKGVSIQSPQSIVSARSTFMNRAVLGSLAALVSILLAAPSRGADGPIELTLDATEAPRKLLHAKLVIPAAPGPLTLYYPKWIPGEHSPTGPINDLSGLKISAGDKTLKWRRDDVDLYAFHCTVPEGANAVEVTLDYLGGPSKEGFTASNSMTARLAIL